VSDLTKRLRDYPLPNCSDINSYFALLTKSLQRAAKLCLPIKRFWPHSRPNCSLSLSIAQTNSKNAYHMWVKGHPMDPTGSLDKAIAHFILLIYYLRLAMSVEGRKWNHTNVEQIFQISSQLLRGLGRVLFYHQFYTHYLPTTDLFLRGTTW
jgi:hypothetical protein